jgi:pyridoxamine 5'-phosphate oxidase family protein
MDKVIFSPAELDYLRSQTLARIGTASRSGRPDVAVVGFDFDGEYFYISGRHNQHTRKYRNTLNNAVASLLIDDLASVKPWRPRGIKFFAQVDFVERQGYAGEKQYLRLRPTRKYSWGLE